MIFALFLAPLMLVSNLLPAIYRNVFVEFAVINVGEGMCVTFSNGRETVMFGCGGDRYSVDAISDYLSDRKIDNVKALYIPVDNKAILANNARVLCKELNVETIVTSAEYKFSFLSENVTSADAIAASYFNGRLKIDYFTEKNFFIHIAKISLDI